MTSIGYLAAHRRNWLWALLALVCAAGATFAVSSLAAAPLPQEQRTSAYAFFSGGHYRQALDLFDRLSSAAQAEDDANATAEAEGMAAYALYLLHRDDQDIDRARDRAIRAIDLANQRRLVEQLPKLHGVLGLIYADKAAEHPSLARREFALAVESAKAAGDTAMMVAAQLQLARVEPDPITRFTTLRQIAGELGARSVDAPNRLNLLSNLLDQAADLSHADLPGKSRTEVLRFANELGRSSLALAEKSGSQRDVSLAAGLLAGLAADQSDWTGSLEYAETAIRKAELAGANDLALRWQAQLGRISHRRGDLDGALDAFRRSAFYIDRIRNDIPLTYPDGRSSYRATLEPLYRELADVLLRHADQVGKDAKADAFLWEAVGSLERLKQSELEDYFSDRCFLEQGAGITAEPGLPSSAAALTSARQLAMRSADTGPMTAVLYPIVLADRLELIAIHAGQIKKMSVAVHATQVQAEVSALARILRTGKDYRKTSRQVFRWLFEPLAEQFKAWGVDRIVYVPDDFLRLIPLSVLSDGKTFVGQRFVIVTNSGLQSERRKPTDQTAENALLVGLSQPGGDASVLEAIPDNVLALVGQSSVRSPGGADDTKENLEVGLRRLRALRGGAEFKKQVADFLALPEVEKEIDSIGKVLPKHKTLMNQEFNEKKLASEFKSGEYQIVHISTHAYFGGSAKDSFVMAYDTLLNIDKMEQIMGSGDNTGGVDLITFSACETAQGDERAPLGFSGLAIKAKAKNAIGALWSINDEATRRFMEEYYGAVAKLGGDKAKAMQMAQAAMAGDPSFKHPSFWAPFVLTGAW